MCHTQHVLLSWPCTLSVLQRHLTAEAEVPTYLLEVATADVVVSQRAPQLAQLVGEAGESTTDYGIYIEGLNLVRVLGDKVAELMPQLQDTGCWGHLSLGPGWRTPLTQPPYSTRPTW